MNFQNTVLAATIGLLTCPDECLGAALARCDGLFDSINLYSTGRPSVAVRSGAGVTPLHDWVMQARAGGVLACRPGFGGTEHGDTPAHMMAGFLGGRPGTLHVRHAGGCDSYSSGTISSATHAMSTAQFAELINAQDHPEFYWPDILADINQFHACNNMVEVARDQLADFLRSDASADVWNFTGDQIMREVQVEALTFGEPFAIPAHLADLFEEVVPWHDMDPYVWLEAFDEDAVTGAHLYQLIIAQAFHAEIWRQCADPLQLAETLGDDFDLSEFPQIDAEEWGTYLQGLDENKAELVRGDLLELIRLECQRRACEPVIPAALQDIFGPDEEERRRLAFRGRLQHDMGWRLKRNPASWHMYVFDQEEGEDGGGDEAEAIARLDHQHRFEAAVEAIEAFAVKVQSPFAVHFQLAKRLAAEARADAPFDRAVFERICASIDAPDYLADTKLVDLFAAFGWRSRRVFGLAAIAAADVFGAMGSWNDQSFDDEDDEDQDDGDDEGVEDDGDDEDDHGNVEFEAVSSQLFYAMNGYLASLLTVDLRNAPSVTTQVQYIAHQLRRLLP